MITLAVFNCLGTIPFNNDILISLVIKCCIEGIFFIFLLESTSISWLALGLISLHKSSTSEAETWKI